MSPWEFLLWVVALSVSTIVVTVAVVVVTVGSRALRLASKRRRTVDG